MDKRERMMIHDLKQAQRRTPEQNQALVNLVISESEDGSKGAWAYSDVPEEGGSVDLTRVDTGQRWVIERDGSVEELKS